MRFPPTLQGIACACLYACATVAAAEPLPDATIATAGLLRDRALAGQHVAWDIAETLTTDIGPRPVGSPALARARELLTERLTALGFRNVHAEEFQKDAAWVRGAESARLTAPDVRSLAVIGLGRSVPTPPTGLEAEVRVFGSLAELEAVPAGGLTGMIALVNAPMTRTDTGVGYEYAVRARQHGASLAAARGAIAYLLRSVATGNSRAPHTGALTYDEGVARIPAAALGIADAELLARLAARGRHPRVQLALASHELPAAPAWNVVGEIPGREPGSGTLVIGGHLDSWDPGEGAIDDAAGVAITIAAARLVAEAPVRPRRTIRVVAFGSEETGGSGDAYAAAHAAEAGSLTLVGESDLGSDRILSVQLPRAWLDTPTARALARVLAPLAVYVSDEPASDGGSDIAPLVARGVPVVNLQQDASRYFDIHHTAEDTLDKIDRGALAQNVATWAALLYLMAEAPAPVAAP